MPPAQDLREVGAGIERLLEELRSDPEARARAEDLVRLVTEFYGAGLERILTMLAEQAGPELVETLAHDPLVASLLVLHDLHPVDVETRVLRALDAVRPYLGSHAGGVDYVGIDDEGFVQLTLQGTCNGCPSSAVTVQMAIERAIQEACPELSGVHVEGVAAPAAEPTLLQIGLRCPTELEGVPA